ncbi:neutral zinc metallopeptidase [Lentimicrobium sp.]|uniref:KPN_02809 family neutral zinc metallopeptidase n=1 Tax=Lentimicrobium sp. TaxID=2034841 RepID=UPI002C035BAE|nr:neutral zinc metallopeptidase [Lentimicrobium sp.]HOP13267.1 neutral zinc metallopeptidase [Lentimicrobium sp.]HPJ62747.1 neutral zinc metallopeptidase [Lentimicrobium sp.]HPR26449.1 neutral zinc metallopeptidase [Lentimicrobium sp.]HRW69864.1 neutral zinc metallopeptidase [Lentimicrobium sp.]
MRWTGRRGSSNVEDRRGMSGGKMALGGGLGTIVIVLIVWLMGGDPGQMLGSLETGQTARPVEASAEEDQMAQFVSVVLADTEEVWKMMFEQSGQTYREPKLVLFRDQVQSACGYASAASGPFYCSGDEKIYIDLSFCEVLKTRFGAQGDFAVAYVIAHEVGHHVQKLLGILEEVQAQRARLSQREANALTVKLELQADFLAGLWAHHADRMMDILETGDIEEALRAAAAVGDDNIQLKSQGRIIPDDFTHGTSEQRMSWFRKGWETGDLAQGDTFRRGAV